MRWDSFYDDYAYGFGLEFGARLGDNDVLKFAPSYKKDVHRESATGTPEQTMSDETWSFALENTYNFTERTVLVLGLSYDIRKPGKGEYWTGSGMIDLNKQFNAKRKGALSYQALLKHSFDGNDELRISFAKKTRFPTMKDRLSYRFGSYVPNPNLKQEDAYHYEIAYDRIFDEHLTLGGAIFYSQVKNQIYSVPFGDTGLYRNENLDEAEFLGFEISGSYAWENVEIGGNYSYLHADGKYTDETWLHHTYLPKHKAFFYVDWKILPNLNMYVSEYLQSRMYTETDTKKWQTGSFGITNLKFTYKPIQELSIEAGVKNLFDKRYEFGEGFSGEGRVFFANFRYDYK